MDGSDGASGRPPGVAVPLWVHAAVSVVSSRRGGNGLLLGCLLGVLYCLPWPDLLGIRTHFSPWYLAPDWSWSIVMALLSAWHAAAVTWMNRHDAWPRRPG